MRNMSFSMTEEQVRNRTKFVTRRLGWEKLKPGEKVRAVRKAMGLKKGERIEPICEIRAVNVRREPLNRMTEDVEYGIEECRKEGFGDDPVYFVKMFCVTHRPCEPHWNITRIEFEYV